MAVAIVSMASQAMSQSILLKGFVVDNEAKPFSGASMSLAGSKASATTSAEGKFEIRVDAVGIEEGRVRKTLHDAVVQDGRLIFFSGTKTNRMELRISNMAGRVVQEIKRSDVSPGMHVIEIFDRQTVVPNGVFVASLDVDGIRSSSVVSLGRGNSLRYHLGASGEQAPAARAALATDTLVIEKSRTVYKKIPISNFIDTTMAILVDLSSDVTPPSGNMAITGRGGWYEAGWVTWSPVAGATGYTVAYKAATGTAWTDVDSKLVRGNRVDILGLPGNATYQIKITAVGATASSTVSIRTKPYDRSGFAFDKRSPRGDSGTTGGYLSDCRINPNATVLHITNENKATIQLAVTKGNSTTTYTGLRDILAARTSAKSRVPLVIRILGAVSWPGGVDTLKMMQIKDNANITIEGVGNDAMLDGWGFDFQRCENVVVRNLGFREQPEDQLSFQNNNFNIWVTHNDHFLGKGNPGADADKLYGDGPLDVKSGSSWVSVGYNYYHQNKKTNGVGFGDDSTNLVMTYHHNFYDRCGSRMPRISYVSMHVYNAYIKEAQTYGIALANKCAAFIQNNYFENSKRPIITASQGHDLSSSGSTLSHNPGGTGKLSGNFMDAFTSDPDRWTPTSALYDATPVGTPNRDWLAPDITLGPALAGGAVYNNFDLNFGSNYPQLLDSPEIAKAKVVEFAGRLR